MIDSKRVEELVLLFLEKKYYLNMGAGKLSKIFKTSKESIYEARSLTKKQLNKINKDTVKLPKILIFDIETSPMISYNFGLYNVNISLDQIIEYPIMLTWSAKWLFSDIIMSDRLTSDEALSRNDYRISKGIWGLINEADIVVAHYGDRFDLPMLNSRFIINGLPPATSVQSIDTKSIASKNFKFPSNKLDALATMFGFSNKIKTDFMLWRRCMEGSNSALEEMVTYNKRDVSLLEEVYLKLRPYAKGHPNVGLYIESLLPVCSHCGNSNIKHESSYYTQTNKYDVYRCDCGALSRVRNSSIDKNVKKNLTISLGR